MTLLLAPFLALSMFKMSTWTYSILFFQDHVMLCLNLMLEEVNVVMCVPPMGQKLKLAMAACEALDVVIRGTRWAPRSARGRRPPIPS